MLEGNVTRFSGRLGRGAAAPGGVCVEWGGFGGAGGDFAHPPLRLAGRRGACQPEVVVDLKPVPELGRHAQGGRNVAGRLGRDRLLASDDLVHGLVGAADNFRELPLRPAAGFKLVGQMQSRLRSREGNFW